MAGNKKPRKKPSNIRQAQQVVIRRGSRRIVMTIPPEPKIPIIYGLNGEQKTELRLPYHISLDALRRGEGTEDDATTIFAALMTGKELAGIYTEAMPEVLEAIQAIEAVKGRADAGGKWLLTGDQYKAISVGLVLLDDLQEVATRRQTRGAIRAVINFAEGETK